MTFSQDSQIIVKRVEIDYKSKMQWVIIKKLFSGQNNAVADMTFQ